MLSETFSEAFYKLFLEHPEHAGESYTKHMGEALWISFNLLLASLACFFHALVPCMFQTTASGICTKIADRVRQRHAEAETAAPKVLVQPHSKPAAAAARDGVRRRAAH